MVFIEPLNLYDIFVEKFSGNLEIFVLISLFILAILAGRFRMPTIVFGMIIFIFLFMVGINTLEGVGNIALGLSIVVGMVLIWVATRRFNED